MALLSDKFGDLKGVLELVLIIFTFLGFWSCKDEIFGIGIQPQIIDHANTG